MQPDRSKTLASAFSDLHRAVSDLRGGRVVPSGPGQSRLAAEFLAMSEEADRIEQVAAAVDLDAEAASAVDSFVRARCAPRVLSFAMEDAKVGFETRLAGLLESARARSLRQMEAAASAASSFVQGAKAVVSGPRGAELLGNFVRFAAIAGVAATLNVSVAGKADAGMFSFLTSSDEVDVKDLKQGPTGAMQDLAVDVLTANLGTQEDALNVLESVDMVVRRCALGDAPRGETACVVKKAGVQFDYNAGRYEMWLLPIEGFSDEPRLVAREADGELVIVDREAYSLVRLRSQNAAVEEASAPEM